MLQNNFCKTDAISLLFAVVGKINFGSFNPPLWTIKGTEMAYCPKCYNEMNTLALFCKKCGYDFPKKKVKTVKKNPLRTTIVCFLHGLQVICLLLTAFTHMLTSEILSSSVVDDTGTIYVFAIFFYCAIPILFGGVALLFYITNIYYHISPVSKKLPLVILFLLCIPSFAIMFLSHIILHRFALFFDVVIYYADMYFSYLIITVAWYEIQEKQYKYSLYLPSIATNFKKC